LAVDQEELLNPRSDKPPFNVCLADFGESTVYQSEDDGYTTRSRGTEFNKSASHDMIATSTYFSIFFS
jgi:hypothetical protein